MPKSNKGASDKNASGDASAADVKATDKSLADVQAKFDDAEAKGHFGVRTDPTPLEHYTVEGVLAGKPTPETDADASAAAAQATSTHPNVEV